MQSQIETLVAATVTTTTFTISGTQKIDEIEVTILSSADTVTVAYGLGGTVPANPTDKADDLDHVPPVVGVPADGRRGTARRRWPRAAPGPRGRDRGRR